MVTTIIILATLLALALGFVVGGGLGMHLAAKETATTINSFAKIVTTDILDTVEEHKRIESEEQSKRMERAAQDAMKALERLENLKKSINEGGPAGCPPFPFRRTPMYSPGSFVDQIMRMSQTQERRNEKPATAVETMGDHFDEIFNREPADGAEETSETHDTSAKEE